MDNKLGKLCSWKWLKIICLVLPLIIGAGKIAYDAIVAANTIQPQLVATVESSPFTAPTTPIPAELINIVLHDLRSEPRQFDAKTDSFWLALYQTEQFLEKIAYHEEELEKVDRVYHVEIDNSADWPIYGSAFNVPGVIQATVDTGTTITNLYSLETRFTDRGFADSYVPIGHVEGHGKTFVTAWASDKLTKHNHDQESHLLDDQYARITYLKTPVGNNWVWLLSNWQFVIVLILSFVPALFIAGMSFQSYLQKRACSPE